MAIVVQSVSSVQPSDIALTLGVATPADTSVQYQQWALWIGDTENIIQARLGDLALLDQTNLAYVVREAVALKVKRPDPASQTTVSVDDGSVTKRYERDTGQIQIAEAWWAMLTPSTDDDAPKAFSITPCFDQTTAP